MKRLFEQKDKRRKIRDLESIASGFVHVLGLLMFAFLSVSSLIFTRFFPQYYDAEVPYNQIDFFPVTLLGTGILAFLAVWAGRFLTRREENAKRNLKILLAAVLGWMLLAGLFWVFTADSTPMVDQKLVFTSAQRFLDGNYGRLDSGKYLFYYPFQLGLVAWESLILTLFGEETSVSLQICNVFFVVLCTFAVYRSIRFLSEKRETAAVGLLLMAGCFQLIVYCSYVYNDVPGLSLCAVAIWQFLRYMRGGRKSGILGMTAAMTMAVLLRSNSLIVMIAFLCILAVKFIAFQNWRYLGCAVLLLLCCLGSRQVVYRYYENKTGKEINEGMPSILWVAMGMQEGDKEAGWYNGYTIYIWEYTCVYDSERAIYLGKEEIKNRLEEFLSRPAYALDFYTRKLTSQWLDPTYGCFIMTYATENERSDFGESLYTGWPNRILQKYMDSYQIMIYAAVLFLLLLTFKERKKVPLEYYLMLTAIIGGMLFHLIWEAKSRYIFPYFILMLPMAAEGLVRSADWARKRRTKDEASESC